MIFAPNTPASSNSSSQTSPKDRVSTQGRLWEGQGPRLTFLRLKEAVLSQLGQERTAGTGRFEVAQGNVRWVETVRQMGKACRKWETEEGNMFYPEQHAALE